MSHPLQCRCGTVKGLVDCGTGRGDLVVHHHDLESPSQW